MLGTLLFVASCSTSEKEASFTIPTCLETSQSPANGEGNSWASATPTPSRRYLLAATTGCDGKIYALGGMEPTGETEETGDTLTIGAVQIYDPTAHTWTPSASMPTPRSDLGAVTGQDGRIYAIGGTTEQYDALDVVEVYSPQSNTWETAASLPTAMSDVNATTDAKGNIYAINDEAMAIYNEEKGTWSSAPAMPIPRQRMVVAAGEDGNIYAIGGFDETSRSKTGPSDVVEVYLPSTREWQKRKSMPVALGQTAGVTAFNGKIYVFGGNQGPDWDVSDVVYAYTPKSDTWEKMRSMPTARETHAAAVGPDGRIYVIDGDARGVDVTNRVDVYTPGS
ncbi:Kelch repeat-containing protein [Streptomyces sp. NPDC005262]|uniref:Kelch repeat-containing protein n=1 Tax=Streptomyces sp. NPDC005262 TaxID=3364710 RepID=UPI00368D5FE6